MFVIAAYAYTYDADGNVISTLDKIKKLRYNYTYNNGQVVQSEEYTVELSGDTVTSATLTHRTELHYKDDKIYQKVEVYVNSGGTEISQTYDYSYLDDEEDKFTLILPTNVRSVSGLDHFGRKSFDELQLGNGFVTRKYEYVKGAYDNEKFAGKLKSTPETELVEKITFNDGKELRYTYDESGNITAIRNENGALLSAYTYDLLGRLKTEQNTVGQFYTVYSYDAGGNITSKSKYTCTSTEIVTDLTGLTLQNTDTYTYDSVWKDKLLSYNGISCTYDNGGNPIQYKGAIATWVKGRQLQVFGLNRYEYNENGIRISKSVNGVKHTYVLDGIKVLREQYLDVTLDFLYGVEEDVVGFVYNDTAYYYRKNLQGDVIGITDSNGTELVTYAYDAWGKLLSVTGDTVLANINPIRYRSYYYDIDTSLYYLNSRYYDPDTCRFINADDAEIINVKKQCQNNVFVYCENNPANNIDIEGYVVTPANLIGAAIGLILGAVGGYFLSKFIAKKLGLRGWKRVVFIIALSAIISAAAAVIGYFIGPYISKAFKSLLKGLKGLFKPKLGTKIGRLGTLTKNTKPVIKGLTKHGLERMAERGISKALAQKIINTGYAISQSGGKILYFTTEGVVVLSATGEVITAYSSAYFDAAMQAIISLFY